MVSVAPSVSVVTIAWRNERFATSFATSLRAAADVAAMNQLELVIVTNGPDGVAATAAVCEACTGSRLSHLEVALDDNLGFSGGMDAGVARAGGEILVIANLDLTFDEMFLLGLEREAAEQSWDILAPRVLQGAAFHEAGASRRKRSHRLAWITPPPSGSAIVPAGNGACIVLRRSALECRLAVTGALFDPEYHSFNEDIDLFWWAERANLVVRYAPELKVVHALAGSFGGAYEFGSRPAEVQRRVMANYRVTVWKNARGFVDWLGWPAGEVQYLGQAVLSRGMAGLGGYAGSWRAALATVRAIRRRRGRLRVSARSST